jgi:TPR repeat protein
MVALIGIFCSCQNKNQEESRSTNTPKESPSELKKAIIENGDTLAYDKLFTMYLDYKYQEELLFYSLIMANKYNYIDAYFDVFYEFFSINEYYGGERNSLDSLDKDSKDMAIRYLKQAVNKGHKQAKDILGDFYIDGKYVEQNIELGRKLKREGLYPTQKQ